MKIQKTVKKIVIINVCNMYKKIIIYILAPHDGTFKLYIISDLHHLDETSRKSSR